MTYDEEKFGAARNKVNSAVYELSDVVELARTVQNIADNYEGKSEVNDVCTNIINIERDIEQLNSDMGNTLGLMRSTASNSSPFSEMAVTFDEPYTAFGGISLLEMGLQFRRYYSNYEGYAADYAVVCPIVGGAKQVPDKCHATAFAYGDLILQSLGINPSTVNHGGYTFDDKQDALNYIGSEISSGHPTVLEVSNASNKHFVLAFGLKTETNLNNVQETDILYLDPVEGEVKQLGVGFEEFDLMARNLMRDTDAETPWGWKGGGYYVGTFDGASPKPTNGNAEDTSSKGRQELAENSTVWITMADGEKYSYSTSNNAYSRQENEVLPSPTVSPWI